MSAAESSSVAPPITDSVQTPQTSEVAVAEVDATGIDTACSNSS
jgi:hypothetical protein